MRKKILLVDDSTTVLLMEKMILRNGNYELILARDGREAVERAHSDNPDLILMDVVMPGMNGLEACRTLRQSEMTRTVPIIMVTTRGEAESVEAGYANGCNDYITKPINALELISKLENLLGD